MLIERIRKILAEETDVDGAVEIIKQLQYAYNNDGKELVPDEVYDELYDFISRNGVEVVGTTNTGSSPVFNHSYPELRGTLDKVHAITIEERKARGDKRRSYEEFVNGVESKVGRPIANDDKVYMFIKYDGTSVIEEVKDGKNIIALKRGDTTKNEAEEIPWLRGVQNGFIDKGEYGVKNEIVMLKSDFDEFCRLYGNFKTPLSAVSSILNSDDYNDKIEFLKSIPLQVKYKNSDVIHYIHGDKMSKEHEGNYSIVGARDYDAIIETIKKLRDYADDNMIPCDGIVFAFINEEIQQVMGRNNNISKWEIAYKFPSTIYSTKVKGIEFSAGVMGGYTPVVNFEPVFIDNKKIQNASLGSIAIARDLQLAVGDEVLLRFNIIPTIEGVGERSGEKPIEIIATCKSCGQPIDMDKERCLNPECDIVRVGKIYNHIDKIGIKYFSYAVVEKLYQAGIVTKISDVYRLPEYIPLELGIGKKTYEKIYNNMKAKKEVTIDTLLGSLGIEGAGVRMFRNILSQIDVQELFKAVKFNSPSRLIELKKVGEITARNIIEGLDELDSELKFIMSKIKTSSEKVPDDATKAIITKVRDPELVKFLRTKNIFVTDKFTKDAAFIIVPDRNVTSSKIAKAEKAGIPVVTIDEIKETSGFNKQ